MKWPTKVIPLHSNESPSIRCKADLFQNATYQNPLIFAQKQRIIGASESMKQKYDFLDVL